MHGVKRFRLSEDLKEQKLARDKIKISNYKDLQNIVLNNKENCIYDDKVLEQTTVLLDLNPEFYTIWNYRRDILERLYPVLETGDFVKELQFVMKQMLKYPKCYWIWNHRIWCLKYLNDADVYRNELEMVNKMLSRDERNFHGWAYRRFVIDMLDKFVENDDQLLKITIGEFEYTTKMINKNISNYSAWHNRSKLVLRIFEQQHESSSAKIFKDKRDFLEKEFEYLTNAMFIDSEDSSIWIYIRWLITTEFFGDDVDGRGELLKTLEKTIVELNELERDDNDNKDNEWCLKTIALIQSSSI